MHGTMCEIAKKEKQREANGKELQRISKVAKSLVLLR